MYEAQIACGTIFVKAFTDHISCDRDCEILEALAEFSLTPNVLTQFDWDNHAVVVTNALSGSQVDHRLQSCSRTTKISLLGAAGSALGNLHRAISPACLHGMKCWESRDGPSTYSIRWSLHLETMIAKWTSRIDPSAVDYVEFSDQLDELLQHCNGLREPARLDLLHCDYIGRNILASDDNRISGILDFETARIGDAVYDLAKMVWVNMDFSDTELWQAFLKGWETTYGEPVPKREFLCYVGVQCLAAIAWVDRNGSFGDSPVFRASAIRTLRTVVSTLRRNS